MYRGFILIAFILIGYQVFARTIKGTVYDKRSQEPLIGASVSVKGDKSIGAATGLDGSFIIRNAPDSAIVLEVSFLGYKTLLVVVDAGVNAVRAGIEEEAQTLSTITIIGTDDKSTDEFINRKMQRSERIVNMVSAKAIQISPDITVANVVNRVSGVSLERNSNGDGQYAIVRGMDKRYNYTLVNGVKIPSPDNKYRYVPLDIFPAELLDRLEVSKSLTPNMEGDAIGGVVNMVMKDAPNQLYVSANVATGYSELFFNRPFESYDLQAVNKQSPYEANGKTYNAKVADFPAGLVDYRSNVPPPNLIAGVAIGNRFLNKRLGVIVAGSYQNTYRGSNSLFFDADNVDTNQVPVVKERNDRYYSEQQRRLGIHAKLDYRFKNLRHRLQWYNAMMDLQNIQVRNTKNVNYSAGYNKATGDASMAFDTRSRFTEQQIYNSTLQGEHDLLSHLKLQWSAVYSLAKSETPDNTKISFYGKRENGIDSMLYADQMTRRWEHNSDQDLAGYASLNYHFGTGKSKAELEAGGMYRTKQRENFYNSYTLNPAPAHQHDVWQRDYYNYTQIPWEVQNPRGSVGNPLTYNASEDITATYAMFRWTIGKLNLVGGVRIEQTSQGYELLYPAGESRPVGEQRYTDVLPSGQLKYELAKKQYLKATYFKAVNRPGFFEIVPYRVTNEEYAERGNPDLKRAIADNVDLRYEFFPRPNEQVMIGVFYKKIKDPIEYTLQPDPLRGQNIFYAPGNFGTAVNYGAEIDVIRYFRSFGIKLNYTYTHSSITTDKSKRIRNEQGDLELISVEQTRPLYGQSNHIGNVTILYKNTKRGIDAQLAWNYTGERINTVAQFIDADLWQKAFVQMDASAEKTIRKFTLFAKANNLLNTPLEVFVKGNNPQNDFKPGQGGANTLIRKDYYQRSYMVGIRWKL